MALSRIHLAYGMISFCQAILHNLFLVYHVDIFIYVYKIGRNEFWMGEAIFLLWNSINDPLFGWLSDSGSLQSGKQSRTDDVVSRRLSAIRRSGPLFALSFLLLWFAWPWPGLQFVVCLCLYDGFLTAIDLHHTALLADMAVALPERTRLEFACSLFNAFGTLALFASYFVWDRSHLSSFRVVCVVLGLVSAAGFALASHILGSAHSKLNAAATKKYDDDVMPDARSNTPHSGSVWSSWSMLTLFAKQIFRHKNFKWFTSMNLLQVFHCHFNSNFFPLFLEHMLGNSVSSWTSAALLSMSFVLPHINNLFFLSLCQRLGVYAVIRLLFALKVLMAVLMIVVGPQNFLILCIFILSNRVFTEGTCKLLNLVVSDLVDEDYVIHGRREPISALIFGTSALLTKPGQSMAPVIGMWFLTKMTGHSPFADQAVSPPGHANTLNSVPLAGGGVSPAMAHDWSGLGLGLGAINMQMACFYMLIGVPLVCGLLQLALWSQFTLHGTRLASVKRHRVMGTSGSAAIRAPV